MVVTEKKSKIPIPTNGKFKPSGGRQNFKKGKKFSPKKKFIKSSISSKVKQDQGEPKENGNNRQDDSQAVVTDPVSVQSPQSSNPVAKRKRCQTSENTPMKQGPETEGNGKEDAGFSNESKVSNSQNDENKQAFKAPSKRSKRNQKRALKKMKLSAESKKAETEDLQTTQTETEPVKSSKEETKTDKKSKQRRPKPGLEFDRSRKFNDKSKPGFRNREETRPRSGMTAAQQKEIDDYRKGLEDQGAPKDVVSAAMFKKIRSIQRRNKRTSERQTSKICLSCRKPGHLVRDCPEASSETGTCFKCGSKEHTSRECPNKSDNYAFATCYICKEKGHLAKHCKQNTHGIYVRGGCCHYCGNVRHFARECPDKNKGNEDSQEEEAPQILAGTLRNATQSADADVNEEFEQKTTKVERKKSAVVKF